MRAGHGRQRSFVDEKYLYKGTWKLHEYVHIMLLSVYQPCKQISFRLDESSFAVKTHKTVLKKQAVFSYPWPGYLKTGHVGLSQ